MSWQRIYINSTMNWYINIIILNNETINNPWPYNWLYKITIINFTITGFINKKYNLLILGLHNAGKSTLLSQMSQLKDGRLVQHTPTNYTYPCKLYIYKQCSTFSVNKRLWWYKRKPDMQNDRVDFKMEDLIKLNIFL